MADAVREAPSTRRDSPLRIGSACFEPNTGSRVTITPISNRAIESQQHATASWLFPSSPTSSPALVPMWDKHLESITNHVFLPPDLPEGADSPEKAERIEHALTESVLEAASEFLKIDAKESAIRNPTWPSVLAMLQFVADYYPYPSKEALEGRLANLRPGYHIAIHVGGQNSGVIVRNEGNCMRFEMFELSSPNEVVMKANKVLCQYPGPAIDIPLSWQQDSDFIAELASFISQLCYRTFDDAAAATKKAGVQVVEERQTIHSRYITSFFTGVLRGIGEIADVKRIIKRIADNVSWRNKFLPWRRSPLWLLIRVALQTALQVDQNHDEYKLFMVYYMATLLRRAVHHSLSNDRLHVMRAKVARRAFKLQESLDPSSNIYAYIMTSLDNAKALIQQRWDRAQKEQALVSYWQPDELDVAEDTQLKLAQSYPYLDVILSRKDTARIPDRFHPSESPRYPPHSTKKLSLQVHDLSAALLANKHEALYDFEMSVALHLDDWVGENLKSNSLGASQLTMLVQLLKVYHETAAPTYHGNVEEQSTMLLTILHLWIAIDRLATAEVPIMLEYEPEISKALFEPLIICTSFDTYRAIRLAQYCHERSSNASHGSVFSNTVDYHSIGPRYYSQSNELQSLRAQIEARAETERSQRRAQLASLNRQYNELISQANSLDCTKETYWSGYRWVNAHRDCKKCPKIKQAKSLRINVHEWPLPSQEVLIYNTVFELRPPSPFIIWRDITYHVLKDVCTPPDTTYHATDVHGYLASYLQHYSTSKTTPRVGLASTAKSFLVAHYRQHKIPSTENAILVPNGMRWILFDSASGVRASPLAANSSLSHYCTFKLASDNRYTKLQFSINTAALLPNQAIAQSSESLTVDIHEFIEFGTLRAGGKLQLLNITRAIAARSLSFDQPAVHILLLQALWQIGPLSASNLTINVSNLLWHYHLNDPRFSHLLVDESVKLLADIKANWLQLVAVRTITVVISRVLAFTEDRDLVVKILQCLKDIRQVTRGWYQDILARLRSSKEDGTHDELEPLAIQALTACKATFGIHDRSHMAQLIKGDGASIFLECAILLYELMPRAGEKQGTQTQYTEMLLSSDRRLALSLEASLISAILANSAILDAAIHEVIEAWLPEAPGVQWLQLASPNERWFTTKLEGSRSQELHINVISGRLLVNGKPINQLPESIAGSSLYLQLFGTDRVHVVPCREQGFSYESTRLFGGFQILFSSGQNKQEPRICIRRPLANDSFELFPPSKWFQDLPKPLIDPFTHWVHTASREVCFLQRASPWSISQTEWRLSLSRNSGHCLRRGSMYLIDPTSATAKMLQAKLAPLESADQIILQSPSVADGTVHMELPRYQMAFVLKPDGLLHSLSHPGFHIDRLQNAGTFVGLKNQLILAPTIPHLSRARKILVPDGKYISSLKGGHTSVRIDVGEVPTITYTAYEIDELLCRVLGDGTLFSHLKRIYLHALTGSILPDPLTQLNGIEAAMRELSSARSFSFQKLDSSSIEMLQNISDLSPQRRWYPEHRKVMEKVQWRRNIPFFVQHDGFARQVVRIFDHANHMSTIEGISTKHKAPAATDLQIRALTRRSSLYGSDLFYLLPHFHPLGDVKRTYLDIVLNQASEEARIATLSQMISSSPLEELSTTTDLMTVLKRWGTVMNPTTVDMHYGDTWHSPQLADLWLGIQSTCQGVRRPAMLFSLCILGYTLPSACDLIPTIVAIAEHPRFRHFDRPRWASYRLTDGFEPIRSSILFALKQQPSFHNSPYTISHYPEETYAEHQKRLRIAEGDFSRALSREAEAVTASLLSQWPCDSPSMPPTGHGIQSYFRKEFGRAISGIQMSFASWNHNRILAEHIAQVQVELNALRSHPRPASTLPTYDAPEQHGKQSSITHLPTLKDTLARTAPSLPPLAPVLIVPSEALQTAMPQSCIDSGFQPLLSPFLSSPVGTIWHRYGIDLQKSSRAALVSPLLHNYADEFDINSALSRVQKCEEYLGKCLQIIRDSLSPSVHQDFIKRADLWPCLTLSVLLTQLSLPDRTNLHQGWKLCLTEVAHSILMLQQARRLLAYVVGKDFLLLNKELAASACVDGNFLARPLQLSVARNMLRPPSRENSIQQLHMGEGKSSVIVPFVASSVANQTELCRVVVLKPLAGQMFGLLVNRLSGLVGRRIFTLPFSRKISLTEESGSKIQGLLEECASAGGILVTLPEHILSFRLMAVLRQLNKISYPTSSLPRLLKSTHQWIWNHARDILDESDEILHSKYQLIYAHGLQLPVADSPNRWITVQEVLSRVSYHLAQISREYPEDLVVQNLSNHSSSLPLITLMKGQAINALVQSIARDALDGRLSTCPQLSSLPSRLQSAAMDFMTHPTLTQDEVQAVMALNSYYGDDHSAWKALLLLRGLLAHQVLPYALSRRYRVDYGLDLGRSLIALPYRAKDAPSLQAEFGHPEVTILLTYLAYQYGGLTPSQVDTSFELLMNIDHRVQEYASWVLEAGYVPDSLRSLSGINLNDAIQRVTQLQPLFRYCRRTINFYLSYIVFPKHAKEFPHRLTTSAWDIAEKRRNITTGFSGTNDNRFLLPTSIEQMDDPSQQGTNAMVLNILLQRENSKYSQLPPDISSWLSAMTADPSTTVLLDVGAQMLHYSNLDLARHWLKRRSDKTAAVFFIEDELYVLTQTGSLQSLQSSPFASRLAECLIYLDDAHTRGTDLKIARDAKAAVTLGPRLTKDRLMQGCMRLRQLGQGQSVRFFAPEVVDRRIREVRQAARGDEPLTTFDVIQWVLTETCEELQRNAPHWVRQGLEYENRRAAWATHIAQPETSGSDVGGSLRKHWLLPEARPLNEMYWSQDEVSSFTRHHRDAKVKPILEKYRELGFTRPLSDDPRLEQEQEREIDVQVEVQKEVQLERPPVPDPATNVLDPHVRKMIRTGDLCTVPGVLLSAFSHVAPNIKAPFEKDAWCCESEIVGTRDFFRTIKRDQKAITPNPQYLRPVNWVLSLKKNEHILVLLSPFEVNELLPEIHTSQHVHLHMYAPRVIKTSPSFEDLDFYTIPPITDPESAPNPSIELITKLNIFAGQLYFRDFAAYCDMLDHFSLFSRSAMTEDDKSPKEIQPDHFVLPEHRRGWHAFQSPFSKSPVPFIKGLMDARRKGTSYMPSHIGKILNAGALHDEDF
ncbi:hypothetical protein DL93DRAFT_2158528 [Clavulina sp. PMI_390]|nr:hypothetical protein DL93DRAFT_2158528 [Clavulina sp. PMI_390]